MGFSELEFLKGDMGLNWDGEGSCLYGVLRDYPVFVYDDSDNREYTVAVFCKDRVDAEESFKKGITDLLSSMPKNCVLGRTDEVRFISVRFNAALLYQENSVYLTRFVKELCELADSLDLEPVLPEQREKEAFSHRNPEKEAFSQQKNVNAPTEKKYVKNPKKAILKGFDKYSLKGFFGAAIGGAAMTVISAIVTAVNPSNVGAMIASWAAGAFIACIVLADYRFFAKKIDIFGAVTSSLITAVCCFAAADFATLRGLYLAMRSLDSSVTIRSAMENWSYYSVLFPSVTDRFTLLLIQNYFSAIIASVLFFTLYFGRHQGVMFGRGGEVLDENTDSGKRKNA